MLLAQARYVEESLGIFAHVINRAKSESVMAIDIFAWLEEVGPFSEAF
jgi:hypothetical protein